MNATDYDKKLFDVDTYGNLMPKSDNETRYKGFTIDVGLSHVKVWDKSDNFVAEYPDVKTAKSAIDAETWIFGQSLANVKPKTCKRKTA